MLVLEIERPSNVDFHEKDLRLHNRTLARTTIVTSSKDSIVLSSSETIAARTLSVTSISRFNSTSFSGLEMLLLVKRIKTSARPSPKREMGHGPAFSSLLGSCSQTSWLILYLSRSSKLSWLVPVSAFICDQIPCPCCHISRFSVILFFSDIVSRTQEVFQTLKAIQPPNGTAQGANTSNEKKGKVQEHLKTIRLLFKRLRLIYEKCNENCQGMEYTHIESLIPLKEEWDMKSDEKKTSESYRLMCEENKEVMEQLSVVYNLKELLTLTTMDLKASIDQNGYSEGNK
uniref:Mediator of RNA polymerase II transcription subunit 30 n=1 Tax=Timema poppense TaxID=170557 RepID=A0A7R9CNG7_TIMPO|nr:unnamed protein product [Timema poppensis]